MNERWLGLCILSGILGFVAFLVASTGAWPLAVPPAAAAVFIGRRAYEADPHR